MGGYVAPVPPSRNDLLLAGRYRLGALLGTGGMADVYEAMDERLERRVAVKLLRPDMSAREDVRMRFESEARSAASLHHPNVVGVFDCGEDGDIPFLVMEKLPGETLGDRMRSGPVDPDWMLRIAGDVLGALGAAHAAGIVHRDVKPGNILIASDGRAKVADFGIAKSLEVAAAADLTGTDQVVGTPAYVAPERMLGQPATPQADLYAVGVLLYEALAGQKPFVGDTPIATAYAIQHATPEPLPQMRAGLPRHVVQAVERAMARDPAARFATAAEMASALGIAAGATAIPAAVAGPSTDATVVSANSTMVLPVGSPIPLVPDLGSQDDEVSLPLTSPIASLLQDRRRLALVGTGALLLLLFLIGLALAGPGSDSPATKLASDLRAQGDSLGKEDGAAAPEAAKSLEALAAKVEDGDGGPEATALLAQLAAWRDGGQMVAPTADRLAETVRRVTGADPAAFTPPTSAPPPTTAPPPPVANQGGEDGGKGKGRGKGDD